MANKKGNPLLGGNQSFSLADSFGPQPALLVPAEAPAQAPAAPPPAAAPPTLFQPSSSTPDPFSSVNLGTTHPPPSISPNASVQALHGSPSNTPPLSAHPSSSSLVGPPPSGLFLLPTSGSAAPAPPPTFSIGSSTLSGGPASNRKSRYVPPPGIHSSGAPPSLPTAASPFPTSPSTSALPAMVGPPDNVPSMNPPPMHMSNSVPDFGKGTHPNMQDQFNYSMEFGAQPTAGATPSVPDAPGKKPEELVYHWFYLQKQVDNVPAYWNAGNNDQTAQQPQQQQQPEPEVWKPFSMIDSVSIDDTFVENPNHNEPVPTEGGRYDVCIKDRTKSAVFWKEDEPTPIRRCSWFFQSHSEGRWVPYSEHLSQQFEREFCEGYATGIWSRKLELEDGEYIMMHSPTVMLHFPTQVRSTLDDWGQIQPPLVRYSFFSHLILFIRSIQLSLFLF